MQRETVGGSIRQPECLISKALHKSVNTNQKPSPFRVRVSLFFVLHQATLWRRRLSAGWLLFVFLLWFISDETKCNDQTTDNCRKTLGVASLNRCPFYCNADKVAVEREIPRLSSAGNPDESKKKERKTQQRRRVDEDRGPRLLRLMNPQLWLPSHGEPGEMRQWSVERLVDLMLPLMAMTAIWRILHFLCSGFTIVLFVT